MRALRELRPLAAMLAACLSSACATAMRCPADGGPAWRELTTQHIQLQTDLDDEDAQDGLLELEQLYGAFEDVIFPYQPKPKIALRIAWFQNSSELRSFAGELLGGFVLQPRDALDESPLLMLAGPLDATGRKLVGYEVAHRFVDFYYSGAPVWMHEGLAQYYSTIKVADDAVSIGLPVPEWTFTKEGRGYCFMTSFGARCLLPFGMFERVKDIVALERDDFHVPHQGELTESTMAAAANYASAWWLVHYLFHGTGDDQARFAKFREELLQGELRSSEYQFATAPDDLDEQLIEYIRSPASFFNGPYNARKVEVASERPLRDAEVHLIWGRARSAKKDQQRALRNEHARALKAEPGNPETQLEMGALQIDVGAIDEALEHFEKALAQEPANPRYLYARAQMLLKAEKNETAADAKARTDAAINALEPQAHSTRALDLLARHALARGDFDRGRGLIQRAVTDDPGCWYCERTMAALASAEGAYSAAIHAQELAVKMMPAEFDPREEMAVLEKLKKAAKTGL